jgi:hypothetical protein
VGRYDDRFHDGLDPFGGDEDGDRHAPDQYLKDSPTSGVAVAHLNSPLPNRIELRCFALITGESTRPPSAESNVPDLAHSDRGAAGAGAEGAVAGANEPDPGITK